MLAGARTLAVRDDETHGGRALTMWRVVKRPRCTEPPAAQVFFFFRFYFFFFALLKMMEGESTKEKRLGEREQEIQRARAREK